MPSFKKEIEGVKNQWNNNNNNDNAAQFVYPARLRLRLIFIHLDLHRRQHFNLGMFRVPPKHLKALSLVL